MPDGDVRAILELTPTNGSEDRYLLEVVVLDSENDQALNGIEVFVENWVNDDPTVDKSAVTGEADDWSDGRAFIEVPQLELSVSANPEGYEYASARVNVDDFPS